MLNYGLLIIFVLALIAFIIAASNYIKSRNKSYNKLELYKNKVDSILKELYEGTESLETYATNYANTRKETESKLQIFKENSSSQMEQIENLRNSAGDSYTRCEESIQNLKTVNTVLKNHTESANNYLNELTEEINNIIQNSGNTPGANFGTELSLVLDNVPVATNNYITISENEITNATLAFDDSIIAYNTIVDNFDSVTKELDEIKNAVDSLTSGAQNSTEYVNLQNSVTKAEKLLIEISGIYNAISSSTDHAIFFQGLIDNLNQIIANSNNYLQSIVTMTDSAVVNADKDVLDAITDINILLDDANIIIGKIPPTYPYLNDTVTIMPSEVSIVFYIDSIQIKIQEAVIEYNISLGYYNKTVDYLNDILKLVDTTINENIDNINLLNDSLLETIDILKKYLPGSTPPPMFSGYEVPEAQQPFTYMTTVPPYTFVPFSQTNTQPPTMQPTTMQPSNNRQFMAPNYSCPQKQGMLDDGTCVSCTSSNSPNGCDIDTPYCTSYGTKIMSCDICPDGLTILDDNACVYECEEGDTNPIMDNINNYCLRHCAPGYYYDTSTNKCVESLVK